VIADELVDFEVVGRVLEENFRRVWARKIADQELAVEVVFSSRSIAPAIALNEKPSAHSILNEAEWMPSRGGRRSVPRRPSVRIIWATWLVSLRMRSFRDLVLRRAV
jgi:hypothetical protein